MSGRSVKETIAVRAGEAFDLARVEAYLRAHIAEMGDGPLEVEQFAAGHSNLTYLLRAGDWEGVLRRPPLGPVAPKAHDMAREAKFLQALAPQFALAPRPYLLAEERDLLGAPFFVMERKRGVVLDRTWPDVWAQTPANARKVAEAAIDTLVALHHVPFHGTELALLGRPEGYMERQVHGWIERYERAKTADVSAAARVATWLREQLTRSAVQASTAAAQATIVHNDFKLNNMLVAPDDPSRVTAVLDWEMATLGDPLCDLAVMLSYWAQEGDSELLQQGLSPLTRLPGFPTRDELIELYATRSGRDVQAMDFYLAFAYFKVAVICQQIYYRYHNGQTQDPRFAAMGNMAQHLIELSAEVAGQ